MKKIILMFCILLCAMDSVKAENAQVVIPATTGLNNFVLYPTSNLFTFLKLDTRNGKIWQVHYAINEDEMQVVLNEKPLATGTSPGRFMLVPTNNMWTFLLLDTVNGKVWHVQWSIAEESRMVVPIK